MLQKTVLIFFILFCSESLFAQEIIKGQVTDAESKAPLPFTNILFSEKGTGTVSNAEGNYTVNLSNLNPTDSITFSYGGYTPKKFLVKDLQKGTNLNVELMPLVINLEEVVITSKNISVKDIMNKVEENFAENYKKEYVKENLFVHSFHRTTVNKDDPIRLKKSSFEGIDQAKSRKIIEMLPDEFINYMDSKHTWYTGKEEHKLVNQKSISLEESSLQKINKEMENTLNFLVEDIESSFNEDKVYYRIKSGIIGTKLKDEEEASSDSLNLENPDVFDSLHYNFKTKYVKISIEEVFDQVMDIDSDFMEFVTKKGKYKYELEGATMIDDDVAYKISFTPKGGNFQGSIFVSSETFAILQMNIEYAPGKRGKHIQLLGIGYSENYKKMRVIFEKGESSYYVKYIYSQKKINFSLERNFSLLKKQKRFMFDKTLEEIKIKTNLHMSSDETREILVLDREKISESEYNNLKEKEIVKVKREQQNSLDLWEGGTVITPTKSLEEYQRKEEI
ncbi:carboxypeptidase-like regulatory domain-containing protein [Flammeovirga aprica]|uniref:Carboxypeptidase-like regulatory domain-containing protein n=1 Tax=Flammeovirga aprica JL-4 TaxID=694437 RepID=A0A7X9RU42_9BACT|nr:carboxypeptidase-like regulatory domain-containing protein [Flammeovirga aprica]NME68492.1 carboxypeptidase-like regulatory domain-containing protein [Flammeovirga aprica JL-4]